MIRVINGKRGDMETVVEMMEEMAMRERWCVFVVWNVVLVVEAML